MIPLLTEHLFPWVGMSLFTAAAGFIVFTQTAKLKFLLSCVGAALLLLGLGVVSVYSIRTDRKEIRETIFSAADAVKRNDLPAFLQKIDPESGKKIAEAVRGLEGVQFDSVNLTDYSLIRIDRRFNPPKAFAALNASVRGSVFASEFSGPFLQIIHFESVELVKSNGKQWRITDNCKFTCPGIDEGTDYLY